MSSIFTHGRINVDFSPADAVAITPGLKLADVLSALGKPYQTALATAAPVSFPRSYCELTTEACANPLLAYETLFPIPSTQCGGCQAWARPWPAQNSGVIGNNPATWGPPMRPGQNGGGVRNSVLAAANTANGYVQPGQTSYDVALSTCSTSSNPAACFKNICGPTGASCYAGNSSAQGYVPPDAYQVDVRDMVPGQFLKTEFQKNLY